MADRDEVVDLDEAGNAIRRLIRDLGRIPDDLRKRLRPEMRQAGQTLLGDARQRASWSTRIPAALRLGTSFSRRRAGVTLYVQRSKAPHARAWEDVTNRGETRHMVHGHRDRWVGHRPRPFAYPAVELYGREATRMVNRVVDRTAREAGFRRTGGG